LQEELFHLPKNKLSKILEGFWIGDGHNGNYPDKRGFNSNKQEVYSTISKQWAKDIQRIGLQTGKSFHIWKQENHQGFGNKPIYRITFNPESHFLKDHGYKDISEVSISHIEDLGKFQTYDWEVKDTHTFVFKNGVITFQCEDGSCLLASILIHNKIPSWKVRVSAGWVTNPSNNKKEGHAYCTYYSVKSDKWVILDWCFFKNLLNIKDRKNYKDNKLYGEIWFSFNNEGSWGNTEDIRKSKVKNILK
jgi:hypothetical protein